MREDERQRMQLPIIWSRVGHWGQAPYVGNHGTIWKWISISLRSNGKNPGMHQREVWVTRPTTDTDDKVKVNLSCTRCEDARGSRSVAPVILKLDIRSKWMVNITLGRCTDRIGGYVSARIGLVGLQSRSGRFAEEENILPLSEIEPRFLSYPARSPVAIPTALSRLLLALVQKKRCGGCLVYTTRYQT